MVTVNPIYRIYVVVWTRFAGENIKLTINMMKMKVLLA